MVVSFALLGSANRVDPSDLDEDIGDKEVLQVVASSPNAIDCCCMTMIVNAAPLNAAASYCLSVASI